MNFLDGFPLGLIGWTALVFLAGYMVGKQRFRDENDLSGPPRDMAKKHMSARRPDHMHAPPPKLPDTITGWANLDPQTEAAIHDALASGNKIEAIKIVREATGMGLKESKEAIDRLG